MGCRFYAMASSSSPAKETPITADPISTAPPLFEKVILEPAIDDETAPQAELG